MELNVAKIASQMAIPVFTDCSQEPVMTIVLQVLQGKDKAEQGVPEEEKKAAMNPTAQDKVGF